MVGVGLLFNLFGPSPIEHGLYALSPLLQPGLELARTPTIGIYIFAGPLSPLQGHLSGYEECGWWRVLQKIPTQSQLHRLGLKF